MREHKQRDGKPTQRDTAVCLSSFGFLRIITISIADLSGDINRNKTFLHFTSRKETLGFWENVCLGEEVFLNNNILTVSLPSFLTHKSLGFGGTLRILILFRLLAHNHTGKTSAARQHSPQKYSAVFVTPSLCFRSCMLFKFKSLE